MQKIIVLSLMLTINIVTCAQVTQLVNMQNPLVNEILAVLARKPSFTLPVEAPLEPIVHHMSEEERQALKTAKKLSKQASKEMQKEKVTFEQNLTKTLQLSLADTEKVFLTPAKASSSTTPASSSTRKKKKKTRAKF